MFLLLTCELGLLDTDGSIEGILDDNEGTWVGGVVGELLSEGGMDIWYVGEIDSEGVIVGATGDVVGANVPLGMVGMIENEGWYELSNVGYIECVGDEVGWAVL